MESLQYVMKRAAQDRDNFPMRIDVTRAYFCASASRDTYVKIPVESQKPGEEQLCGKLKKAMYNTRGAEQTW